MSSPAKHQKVFLFLVVLGLAGTAPFVSSDLFAVFPKQQSSLEALLEVKEPVPANLALQRTSVKWKRPATAAHNARLTSETQDVSHFPASKEIPAVQTLLPAASKGIHAVSIAVNPDDFVGYSRGIYVQGEQQWETDNYRKLKGLQVNWWEQPANYHQRGKKWERPAHIEFFDPKGDPLLSMYAGIRLNGNATRAFPQKSIRVSARSKYGAPILKADFFQDGFDEFDHLLLRNGGNDADRAFMRDVITQQTMEGTAVDIQRYALANVYINGEYWGLHYLRDRVNENHFALQNTLGLDEIWMLEKDMELYHGPETAVNDFKEILTFAETADLNQPQNLEQVSDRVDLANFIDYLLAEIYVVNTDWPSNNVKYWRPKYQSKLESEQEQWRWVLFDTDYGLDYTYVGAWQTDMFKVLHRSNSSIARLFKALCTSEHFRKQFEARANDLLDRNFSPEQMLQRIDKQEALLAPYMPMQLARWRRPASMQAWKQNVEVIRNFARNRSSLMRQQMQAYLERW